jgi:phenylpyruvate tautomerase PptA (4-oxalocrotonate tautomerase family)
MTAVAVVEETVEQKRWVARVTNQILKCLGSPPALYDVQVRHVNGQSYRVNVRVRRPGASDIDLPQVEIVQSYFCEINGFGEVVWSDPTIRRSYA